MIGIITEIQISVVYNFVANFLLFQKHYLLWHYSRYKWRHHHVGMHETFNALKELKVLQGRLTCSWSFDVGVHIKLLQRLKRWKQIHQTQLGLSSKKVRDNKI